MTENHTKLQHTTYISGGVKINIGLGTGDFYLITMLSFILKNGLKYGKNLDYQIWMASIKLFIFLFPILHCIFRKFETKIHHSEVILYLFL